MRWVAFTLALLLAQPLLADSNLPPAYWANRQLPDARQEAQAQSLMGELRCLVCQGQSIAAASDYRRFWIAAAWGLETNTSPQQYWD